MKSFLLLFKAKTNFCLKCEKSLWINILHLFSLSPFLPLSPNCNTQVILS